MKKTATITISDEVQSMGLILAKRYLDSNNLSGIISYVIKNEFSSLEEINPEVSVLLKEALEARKKK